MNKTMSFSQLQPTVWMLAALALLTLGIDRVQAQTPAAAVPEEDAWTALSPAELETLVGPIALYPDDLIAVVLPASTFPLQVVQAARYLEARESNPELEPDAAWDDSIVALLNYPEALTLLNDDLDWTYELGEAVVYQQGDVLNAVQAFRGLAQDAGNLATDERQVVAVEDDGAITISPADPEVVYVPYYDPAHVVVHQHVPVYHYYPYGYPVYYYPYPTGYSFRAGLFWGVTSAFLLNWHDHYLHVRHHSHFGHPYYGYSYYNPWYSRTNIYINVNNYGSYYRWRPSYTIGGRPRHYAGFSRLRNRHFNRNYVRGPSERYVRGSGYSTRRYDTTPSVNEQRMRRLRTGARTADDLRVRNGSARDRNVDRRLRDVRGAGGRLALRDRTGNANRTTGNARDNGTRVTRPQTLRQNNGRRVEARTGGQSNALGRVAQPRAQINGRRTQARVGDRANALGRAARTPRIDSRPRLGGGQASGSRGTLGRVAPQARTQPNRSSARPGLNREQPMSPPRARSSGRSFDGGGQSRGGAFAGGGRSQPRASGARSGGGRVAVPNRGGARVAGPTRGGSGGFVRGSGRAQASNAPGRSGGGGRMRASTGGNRRAR